MGPTTDLRPTRVRFRVMAFLLALSFLTYFDRVCIVRVQGEIQSELHLTDPELGLVMGAFWLAYCLFEIPTGWLGDRYGARRTLTRVVLAWSLFTVTRTARTAMTRSTKAPPPRRSQMSMRFRIMD